MMSKKEILTNKIARLCYLLGSACLLVVVTISFVQPPEEAVGAPSVDHCKPGYVYRQEGPPPWEYNGTEIITEVQIKSAQGCFKLTTSKPTDGCYQAVGLGTTNVRVSRSGEASPECQAISHVYYYADKEEPTSTPIDTATPTETTTPIVTDPIVTLTPTETHTPLVTNTPVTPPPTDSPPGATPTGPAPEPSSTKPPTIPPPTIPPGTPTPQILIPVTGVDQAAPGPGSGNSYWLFLYLGLGLLGTGMIFHGIAARLIWKK